VVDLQIQTPDAHRHRPRQAEDVDLGEAGDALMVQVDLKHALVKGLCGAGLVLLDDVGATFEDQLHKILLRDIQDVGMDIRERVNLELAARATELFIFGSNLRLSRGLC
jgi:hypothetical protein